MRILTTATLWLTSLLLPLHSVLADSGSVAWDDWSFEYHAGQTPGGLTLYDVQYRNHKILYQASFPVMRVQYLTDACGPFADILWQGNYVPIKPHTDINACGNEAFCKRTFEKDGEQFLEMGINAKLGEYEIYQSYVFSDRGYFDALVFSRGLQCAEDHTHHAHWRLDFDIDGAANDQVFKNAGFLQSHEFNDKRDATGFWSIQDTQTGTRVEIIPGASDGFPDNFSQWDVAVRKFHREEPDIWLWGPMGEIGEKFLNDENIDKADSVF
ncbi:MAG: hypothetical protein AAF404_17120, partial [Pseudomonadota bacterium]